jgi:hypothetical protein
MITPADYSEWCDVTGLYLGNVSEADRYRTFQPKLSRAGFVTRVVHDFLRDSDGGIDLQRWRSMDVPETGDELTYRTEETARALEEIGAPRVAAKMRTVQDTSPLGLFSQGFMQSGGTLEGMKELMKQFNPADLMDQIRATLARQAPEMAARAGMPILEKKSVPLDPDIEPFEQVELLLTKYVKAHQKDLRADMGKYGDVRKEPGYDPKVRQKELEALREQAVDRECQRDDLATMQGHLVSMESQLAKNPKLKPERLAGPRRELLRLYRQYSRRPAEELLPELRAWLPQAEAFLKQHPKLFHPKPTTDKALLKRLADLGDYHMDTDAHFTTISWDDPQGFTCDWCSFSLRLAYPPNQQEQLSELLAVCERLRRRFPKVQTDLRQEVLERFAIYNADVDSDEYELDEDGNPTEESILKTVDGGSIQVTAYDAGGGFEIAAYFGVDWDPEHGAETHIADEPEDEPAAVEIASVRVEFRDSGPKLSPKDLDAFEKQNKLKLPGDYREFLLVHNGGRPSPNHLKQNQLALDIDRLYALQSKGDDDLAAALARHRQRNLPKHYLPIGRVLIPSPMGGQAPADLLLGLSGKQEGKVLTVMHPYASLPGAVPAGGEAQMAAMMAMMFEQFCTPIAPNLATLLSRLTARPATKAPDWLDAIRQGDAGRFAQWLRGGGDLTERFTGYGEMIIRTVQDYLAREAPAAFLKTLLDQSLIKPEQLVASWLRSERNSKRFEELRPLLPKKLWHCAFASPQVWDDSELLQTLLAAQVDLDGPIDDEEATPLHFAIHAGRADGVRWLLAHGASPAKPDKYERTGLLWAEGDRQLECLKVLLEAGESLESLFPHMRTMKDKLRLLKSRWLAQYDELAAYLRCRGLDA